MTFKEVKAELAKYDLGPGTRLKVTRVWDIPYRRRTMIKFTLYVDRSDVDTYRAIGKVVTVEISNDSYMPQDRMFPRNIRNQILDMWHSLNEHELQEWLTFDGVRVFEPHS